MRHESRQQYGWSGSSGMQMVVAWSTLITRSLPSTSSNTSGGLPGFSRTVADWSFPGGSSASVAAATFF
eukprot:6099340-Pleurochrysis_carterae.AAC.1